MSAKFKCTLSLTVLLIIFFTVEEFICNAQIGGFQSIKYNKISWQKPFKENGFTVIIGSVKINTGKFEFRWIINKNGTAKLMTLESPGAGESPSSEKKLFLWVRDERITYLFQERAPLVNGNEPRTIQPIVNVLTNELFTVLPKLKLPPFSTLSQQPQPILWGSKYSKKDIQYLPGSLKASFGTLNIYWKKENEHMPELIILESPGAGELPPRETKLYLWIDASASTSIIFQERQPLLNQGITPYLWPLVVVKTVELMSGFKQVSR